MGIVVDNVVRQSIRQAFWYLEAAQEMDQAVLPGREVLTVDPAYQVSEQLGLAATGLYCAISNGIAHRITLYHAGALDQSAWDEIAPWAKAHSSDHLQQHGWVHRVVNEMLALRSANGYRNLGDEEFFRIFQVIAASQYDELLLKPRAPAAEPPQEQDFGASDLDDYDFR